MAEEVLVREPLTREMIETGRRFLALLDESDLGVVGALWFFFTEANTWRFVVVTPVVESHGPLEAYHRIGQVQQRPEAQPLEIPFDGVTALGPKDRLVLNLQSAIDPGADSSGFRFKQNWVNGMFIEDAYIYRL